MSYEEGLYAHTPTERSETEGIPGSDASSSSSAEFGVDFHPLLSPPNVEEEEMEEDYSSSQWPPAPLFLRVMCQVRDEGGESLVTAMDMEELPLCLSEFRRKVLLFSFR